MITIKLPIGVNERGSVEFQEWTAEYCPLQTVTFYLPDDLKGIALNRIIVSGKSYPQVPEIELYNNEPLTEEQTQDLLNSVSPVDGDEIIIIPGLGGPLVGIIAAVAAFMVAHPIIALVVKMVVSFAISTLLSYLTSPAKPKGQQTDNSPTSYGWQGVQNSYGGGDPIPVIFGKHRVGVKVIYYSIEEEYVKSKWGKKFEFDLTRTKMFLSMLGVLGHGEVNSISDIRLNDNPITNYGSDVEITTKTGTADQTAIPGFDQTKTTYQIGAELPYTPKWKKYKSKAAGTQVVPTDETSAAYRDCIYECTVAGTTGSTEPAWPTTPDETVVDGSVTWKCKADSRYQYTTTEGVDITSYKVHLEAPQGIYFSDTDGVGYNSVTIKIEDRAYGETTWTDRGEFVGAAAKTAVARWAILVEDLTAGRYDIRVTQIACKKPQEKYNSGTKLASTTTQVSKITEIQEIDPQTYAGYALIGIRALATASLDDNAPTLTALVEGVKVPVWHSDTSEWVAEWSQNPLYIAREIMLNPKWGFGNWIDSTRVDDVSLISAATDCDTLVDGKAKHTLNLVWDQRRKLYPMLTDILGPARVMMFYGGGKFRFVYDKARNSTQLFTMGNIVKNSLTVEWIDERKDYNAYDVSILYDQQNYKTYPFRMTMGYTPVKPKNITLSGVTDLAEAMRDARYQLNISDKLHESVSFEAGIDAIVCLPGDVISFAHDVLKSSLAAARVAHDSTSLTTVELDEAVTLEAGVTYYLMVRFSEGENADTTETKVVANGAGVHTTITVSEAFSQLPKKHDLYAIGELSKVIKKYTLFEVTRKSNLTRELNALEYNEDVYSDTETATDDTTTGEITPNDRPPNAIISADATQDAQVGSDGVTYYHLTMNWPMPERSVGYAEYKGANIYYGCPDITTNLGDFEDSEGWTGGEANVTFGQYKKGQSYKITSTNEAWGYASRTLGAALDLSDADNKYVGLLVYINNANNLYDGTSFTVRIKNDDSNYFYANKTNDDLTTGWNFLLIDKDDFSEFGSPDWATIASYQIGVKSVNPGAVEVSLDSFYFYEDFGWVFRDSAVGTSYQWANVKQGENYLFKLHPYSIGGIENVTPAYAGVNISAYDATAPAVPTGLDLSSEGRLITARVTLNTEDDFLGYEWHFKAGNSDFTPDATTLYSSTKSNVCQYQADADGDYACKVRAYDRSVPANCSDYCSFSYINVLRETLEIDANTDIYNTKAAFLVPSSYYMDLRAAKTGDYEEQITAEWLTLRDSSNPPQTLGLAGVDVKNTIVGKAVSAACSGSVVSQSYFDPPYGTNPWTNPNNVLLDDASKATVEISSFQSDYLDITDFAALSLDDSAVVTGIKVDVKASFIGDDYAFTPQMNARIIKGGTATGETKTFTTACHPDGVETYMPFGGVGTMWSLGSVSGADVKASNFGVRLYATKYSGSGDSLIASVNHVRITIYYEDANYYGADGRDQATAFASQWIHFFVIYNPTTKQIASLSSLSATAPTLPAGFTYYVRTGSNYVAATGKLSNTYQFNNRCFKEVTVLNNATGPGTITNGVSGSALDLSSAIPPTAKYVFGYFGLSSNPGSTKSMHLYSKYVSGVQLFRVDFTLTYGTIRNSAPLGGIFFELPLLDAQYLYWYTSDKSSIYWLKVLGWEDDI